MTAEEYLKKISPNDEYGFREKLNKHLLRRMVTNAMESYNKESSNKLVDTLNRIVDVKNNMRYYEDFDQKLMEAIDQAEKALENHLK